MGQKNREDKYTLSLVSKTHQSLAETINSIQELNPCGGNLLEVQNDHAYLLHLQGHSEAAICAFQDALKLANKNVLTLDINADKQAYRKHVSETYANFGWGLAMVGRNEEASIYLKKGYSLLNSLESAMAQKVNALIDYYNTPDRIKG
jgi:tetratricopeptide (TPR) repeat protein